MTRPKTFLEKEKQRVAERERRITNIISRFSVSYMSNAKWYKTLATLDEISPRPKACQWKFVDADRIFQTLFPIGGILEETYMENNFGVVAYREIEWIEVVSENPESIIKALETIGKFELELTADGVRLYGYC